MDLLALSRLLGPALLAAGAAVAFDRAMEGRRLLPGALAREPWRRLAAGLVLWGVLWLGVFLPLGTVGLEQPLFDPSAATVPRLFLLHGLLTAGLAAWMLLAFPPSGRQRQPLAFLGRWARQLGLRTAGPFEELGVGLVVGVGAWLAVIAAAVTLAVVMALLGGEEMLPREPPEVIPWIAGLPLAVRVLLSLSAGVVEELFFRGFLQPRVGVLASSACFVLAHLSYQQPFMLAGVAVLSLIYAGLVKWRQSIWAAVVAHFLFDAVQLLVVIPSALEALPGGGAGGPEEGAGALLAGLVAMASGC